MQAEAQLVVIRQWRDSHNGNQPDYLTQVGLINSARAQCQEIVLSEELYEQIPEEQDEETYPTGGVGRVELGTPPGGRRGLGGGGTGEPGPVEDGAPVGSDRGDRGRRGGALAGTDSDLSSLTRKLGDHGLVGTGGGAPPAFRWG